MAKKTKKVLFRIIIGLIILLLVLSLAIKIFGEDMEPETADIEIRLEDVITPGSFEMAFARHR